MQKRKCHNRKMSQQKNVTTEKKMNNNNEYNMEENFMAEDMHFAMCASKLFIKLSKT